MCVTKIIWVRCIYKYSVEFLQLQGGAEVTLCGPRVSRLRLIAKTRSVGLHQGKRRAVSCSPHKHRMYER